jgi:hypothetical protein
LVERLAASETLGAGLSWQSAAHLEAGQTSFEEAKRDICYLRDRGCLTP